MSKAKATILVVDDYLENLRMLSGILTQQGYRVRKATSGQIALETIQAEVPDLILLDIRMPEMDGYEVCSKLKAEPEFCKIPVIFLSALDHASDKVKAFAVGGVDYITKPFQAEEVLARIQHQLTIQQQQQALNKQNCLLQQKIQERQQAERETQLLLSTIQAISQASSFNTALYAVLREVHQAIGWDYGEAWAAGEEATAFYLSQTCYDSQDLRLAQFHQASLAFLYTPAAGLPGQIWTSQQPQWLDDLSQTSAPLFLRTQAAIEAGLKTGFGVPIAVNHQVLASLVFFNRSLIAYDAKLLQLVNGVALQLGIFMQRLRAEDALRRANQELQKLANLDALTQIANRRYFDETLNSQWLRLKREQLPLSLIMADVDYFKSYNDCYGHQAGDECLKQVAQAIQQSIQRPGDLAARYGGEEFAVILPNTPIQGAISIAEEIQKVIAQLQLPHAGSLISEMITLSFGVTSFIPVAGYSPQHAIAAADHALYAAKSQGRNTICVQTIEVTTGCAS